MPSKKSSDAFTSFRILGKRAQALLVHASQEFKRREQKLSEPAENPREETGKEDLTIRFAPLSIVQAAMLLVAIALAAWMILVLRDKIILLLLSFFVAGIIDPGVRMLERMGFPRGIGILLHYFVALCVVMFLVISLIPIIASQLQQIALLINAQVNHFLLNPEFSLPLVTPEVNRELSDVAKSTLQSLSINKFTDALQQMGTNMSSLRQFSLTFAGMATRIAGSVVDFFIRLIVVLVLAFFIQLEREHLRVWFRSFFRYRQRVYIDSKLEAIQQKIGQWARGQVLLGVSIGMLVFVALAILRIPYAATLAVLAGFTEFIPYIGPFIAAVPAVLIAVTEGGFLWALIVAGVYYVVQWCENNLLVPLIMKRAVGLSPIAIIFAMLVGLSFPDVIHPILGLLIAVPVTTIIAIFLDDWRKAPSASV